MEGIVITPYTPTFLYRSSKIKPKKNYWAIINPVKILFLSLGSSAIIYNKNLCQAPRSQRRPIY